MDPRTSRSSKTRILIVDDHAVFRAGLKRLVSRERNFTVCGEAGTGDEALKIVESHRPHIVLMDIALDGVSGIDLTKTIRGKYPETKVLVLSMHKESIYAGQALKAGALGYLMKQETPERLLSAIKQVMKGQVQVSQAIVSDLVQRLPDGTDSSMVRIESLSDRELQVFRLIGQGRGTRQIAGDLVLSVKTIESYRAHIKDKLHFETSYQLVRAAICFVQQEKQP
jgi:DNA-binding NarL/FixJ family response regulator